jgi:hypothetical protein
MQKIRQKFRLEIIAAIWIVAISALRFAILVLIRIKVLLVSCVLRSRLVEVLVALVLAISGLFHFVLVSILELLIAIHIIMGQRHVLNSAI